MSRMHARRLKRVVVMLAALLVLPLLAREGLALAIVVAPNCLGSGAPSLQGEPRVLRVTARNGNRIAATVLEPRHPAKGSIVLLHGVRMDRGGLRETAEPFVHAGYRAVLVDLPGHGESDGTFLTYGVREAAEVSELLDALEAHGQLATPVGVYGFSYGGAVAIQLAARDARVGAVAAVSTFSNLEQVVSDYARRYLPVLGSHLPNRMIHAAVAEAGAIADFDPSEANTAAAAARLRVPLLLMHGSSDQQVRPYHSVALSRAAGALSELVVLPGETHATMYADRNHAVRQRCVEWFDRWLFPASDPAS